MESELKFQVPAKRSAALARAVGTASAQLTLLQAVYVDTPGLALARAGLALRMRREGTRWVQTLKGGDRLMARQEHEVALPPQAGTAGAVPAIDPARHAGTAVGDALAAVLAQGGELCPLYRTEVQRLHRSVRFAGATIEIAHDVGSLMAGDRRQALDEVEFELKSGPPEALPALAQRWVTRFGLWWDVRPKAEQGVRLALGQDQVPAARSKPSTLTDDASPAQAWSLALQAALTHALPNAAEIAAGRGGPDHLHQLRVALRRLRVALRLFAPWSADAEAALALEQAWRLPFGVLGAARDADVIAQSLRPQLAQAGAPNFAWPQLAAGLAPGDCVRGVVFNTLLLRTLAMSLQPPALQAPANLEAAAAEVLRPAWRRVRRDGHDFLQASADARHRTRKRLKRFRYALDFLRPIYPRKDTQRLLAAVEDALVALGDLNDLEVAHEACRGQVERDPAAWFAVGWLAAQREPAIALAAARLLALDDAPRVWRGD